MTDHTSTDLPEGPPQALLDEAWRRLARGVADRRAPARHPTLATRGIGGWPEARTVVLRGADRSAATLEVHTDAASAKIADLRAHPLASLHVWEPRARLQIRLRAEVEILTGPETATRWSRVPEGARAVYRSQPAPGQPLERPETLRTDGTGSPARFAVLLAHVREIDLLHLAPGGHRRALFLAQDAFAGRWIAP